MENQHFLGLKWSIILTVERIVIYAVMIGVEYGIYWIACGLSYLWSHSSGSFLYGLIVLVGLLSSCFICAIYGFLLLLTGVVCSIKHIIQCARYIIEGPYDVDMPCPVDFAYREKPIYEYIPKTWAEKKREKEENARERSRKKKSKEEIQEELDEILREAERRQREERERQEREEQERQRERERRQQYVSPVPQTFAEACEVLGVTVGLTKAEYKQAYRKKALEYHSDKFQDAGEKIRKVAEEEMKRINAAWDIINREMPG